MLDVLTISEYLIRVPSAFLTVIDVDNKEYFLLIAIICLYQAWISFQAGIYVYSRYVYKK